MAAKHVHRILKENGKFNVSKRRRRGVPWEDAYHSTLTMNWFYFFLVLFTLYLALNFGFALAYFLAGPEAIDGARTTSDLQRFTDDFFFSVQTFSTIGYGKMSPNGIFPNILVTLEALAGMVSIAIVAGILFARFSRPTARVLFSRNAIIGMHDGQYTLSIRMANERLNEIVDAQVSAYVIVDTKTKEGQQFRVPLDLPLQRSKSSIFALSWTLFHTIDEQSPLFGKTRDDLDAIHAEIFVTLVGIDDTFSASIHSRRSYLPSEIVYDHRYTDMLHRHDDGKFFLDLTKIHDTTPMESVHKSV